MATQGDVRTVTPNHDHRSGLCMGYVWWRQTDCSHIYVFKKKKKRKRLRIHVQLFTGFSGFDEHQWRSGNQAWCSLTPKGSAVCCCLLFCPPSTHPIPLHTTSTTTPLCPSAPICTQQICTCALLTVMVISREQQANVGQWINTSLTPDPTNR